MKINSLYMPDSCLQGDSFPAHIIWNKNDSITIKLNLPKSIKIKDLFNVQNEDIIQKSQNSCVIKNFDINGYLGLVFTSDFYDSPKVQESIEFEIFDMESQEISKHVKKIELFRPYIKIESVPSKILINKANESNNCTLSEKIKLKNCGDGTALIAVEFTTDNDFIRSAPSGYNDFVKKFLMDLEIKLTDLKEKYQEYQNLIENFLNLIKQPISLTDGFREQIKELDNELTKKFEENEGFREEFVSAIIISYIENIELITEIRSFIEYLNSIGKGRIVLLNSIEVIKPKNKSGKIELQIQMTDLAYHNFPAIKLPEIEIICDTDCEIPIHSVFEWK